MTNKKSLGRGSLIFVHMGVCVCVLTIVARLRPCHIANSVTYTHTHTHTQHGLAGPLYKSNERVVYHVGEDLPQSVSVDLIPIQNQNHSSIGRRPSHHSSLATNNGPRRVGCADKHRSSSVSPERLSSSRLPSYCSFLLFLFFFFHCII